MNTISQLEITMNTTKLKLMLASAIVMAATVTSLEAQIGRFDRIIVEDSFPDILLENPSSPVYRYFRIANSGTKMSISTPSSPFTKFVLHDEAPILSLSIAKFGLGIGIEDPSEALHIFAADSSFIDNGYDQARILLENAQEATEMRTMVELVNNGPARMVFDNTASGEAWAIQTGSQNQMVISRSGTGGGEFIIKQDGAVVMGPGNQSNFVLSSNGNLTIKGSLNQQSDVHSKTAFGEVDSFDILDKVANLPITSWQYKDDDKSVRHIGPTAQDFKATFGLGQDEKSIAAVDTDGVALVAIKALNKRLNEKDLKIQQLEKQLSDQFDEHRSRVEELEFQMQELRGMLLNGQ